MSQDTPTTPAPTFTAEQLQRASVAVYIECGPSIAAELSAMLQFAASLVRREEQHEKRLKALETILRGFDEGVFVRDISNDSDPMWAIKLFPFIQALALAAKPTEAP